MITERNMIFANPLAYLVFPNMVNPYNTGTTELARYTGYLIITDNNGNTHSFTNTSAIDFTTISGLVTIDNVTDRGSVLLGRWRIPLSIIITNDITVTVTPIDEVSSDGATITPQYEVKHNTYSNGELTESIVIAPDNVTLQSNVEWITISNNQIVVAANTNTEARQGQVTIRVLFQEYSTTANYDIVQAGYDIELDIMQSMVLWYDIAKQGATNESMATTPTLIDHSGNGHHATCYNFAWSGMSGIGGYSVNFLNFQVTNGSNIQRTEHKIVVTNHSDNKTNLWRSYTDPPLGLIQYPSYKIRVSGLSNKETIMFTYYTGDDFSNVRNIIIGNGENTIPQMTVNVVTENLGYKTLFDFGLSYVLDKEIIIEQLPQYPNALVSDGVDDYCLVDGLPLLNNEDGYTVIAKREWIGDANSKSQGFVSKGSTAIWTDGAFYFECAEGGGISLFNRVFPNSNSKDGNNVISSFAQENLTYLTSAKYNNSDIVNVGDGVDTDKLVVFRLSTSSSTHYASISLYSLLLFNRDLTTEEIEWVKTNLIESEQ